MDRESEDIFLFYKLITQKAITDDEKIKLVNLVLKYPNLTRFSATIFLQIDLEVLSRKSEFNRIIHYRNAIIANYLKQKAFLKKLTQDINKEKINVVLLKSNALNDYIYESSKYRGNSDIDILVAQRDILKFNDILAKYATKECIDKKNPFSNLYEETWIENKTGVLVDVHTNITNPLLFNLQVDEIFRNSLKHKTYNNSYVKIMEAELNFIHLALHIINDGYYLHHSLVDAVFILSKNKIDYEKLVKVSQKMKCEFIVKLLLYIINENFYETEIKYKKSIKLIIAKKILSKKLREKSFFRRIQQILIHYLLIDSKSNVIRSHLCYLKNL